MDFSKTEIRTDPLEDFRNNFFQKVENDKRQKEVELKRKQKNCFHKYTRFVPYNQNLTLAVCDICSHVKFVKN